MKKIEMKIETAGDFLQKFYRVQGIGDKDLREKFSVMRQYALIAKTLQNLYWKIH